MGKRGPTPRPFECREDLFWYLVGVVATDGCLSGNGRTITIAAKDAKYLTALRDALKVRCCVGQGRSGYGYIVHRLQIGSKSLYNRLVALGLSQRKSLVLGPLDVPDHGLKDFLRGVIDGDGGIRRWQHPTNGREQWAVRIVGCSKPFLVWLQETSRRLWGVVGTLHEELGRDARRHMKYTLTFGKLAAKVILADCY